MSSEAPHTTSSVPTIERFAELSALLDDPFADRAALLRAAALDVEGWERTVAQWSARMSTEEGESLAARFGDVYCATKRRRAIASPTNETSAARFLSAEAQPWRAEAARVGDLATASPARTADIDLRAIAASLPFRPALPSRAPTPVAHATPPRGEDVGGTLPLGTSPPGLALPFQPKR